MLSRLIKAEGLLCIDAGAIVCVYVHPLFGWPLVEIGAMKLRTARAIARRGW